MSETENPERGLTEKGFQDIKKVAGCLEKLAVEVSQILHSGELRARQTAVVLAEHIRVKNGISPTDGLDPLDNPRIWFGRISGMDENLMLVGHLPYMERLTALILYNDEDGNSMGFKTGSVVCLRKFADNRWVMQWSVTPDIL